MPLDFGRESFYYARRDLIEKRLAWIRHCTQEVCFNIVLDTKNEYPINLYRFTIIDLLY